MTGLLHIDGELVSWDERHVSALDRGFRYGDAVFETIRVYGGTPFAWDRHLERLAASADAIGLDHGLAVAELRARADQTLAANELTDAYLRLSISRGVQPGTLAPADATDPTVVVQVEPLPRGGTAGSSTWTDPLECLIADTRRMPDEVIPAHIKSHNYLNGILAKQEAAAAGVDEALLLDVDGTLTEATTANLFVVVDGELRTPAVDTLPVLPGITREQVIALAGELEIPVVEGAWAPALLDEGTELFLTNTTWEVRPVVRVGTREYDVGPITDRLATRFRRLVERTCYDDSAR